jgi:hypothetical protein
MSAKLNSDSFAPHAITVTGVILYLLKAPYAGLVVYIGFTVTALYYLITELKNKNTSNRFYKIILLTLPSLILILTTLSLITGSNNFLPIVMILFMYSVVHVRFNKRPTEKTQ